MRVIQEVCLLVLLMYYVGLLVSAPKVAFVSVRKPCSGHAQDSWKNWKIKKQENPRVLQLQSHILHLYHTAEPSSVEEMGLPFTGVCRKGNFGLSMSISQKFPFLESRLFSLWRLSTSSYTVRFLPKTVAFAGFCKLTYFFLGSKEGNV